MKILVVHGLRGDSRLTTIHHALSFARHAYGHQVTYVNGLGIIDNELLESDFDLAIATYELLAQRNTPYWGYLAERLERLFARAQVRVIMPQDDYSTCALLDDFVIRTETQFVFSPIRRDLQVLYPGATQAGVVFKEALTGYWETSTSIDVDQWRKKFEDRTIDLGQRIRHLPPHFGQSAERKGQLALDFSDRCRELGFVCDVSTRDEDVLLGVKWWEFLGNIRFTVGRLGGASIADPYGKYAERSYRLSVRRPSLSRSELTERLRLDRAPTGDFSAVSPRLFEAAAMGVCQILEDDVYFEGFQPWTHFIPLDENFGNLEEVTDFMRDGSACEEIVRNAEEFLIRSERFSYRSFVREFLKSTLGIDATDNIRPQFVDQDSQLFELTAPDKPVSGQSGTDHKHPYLKLTRGQGDVWIDAYKSGYLLAESFFVPWIGATEALTRT